jgi:hypothetical protein
MPHTGDRKSLLSTSTTDHPTPLVHERQSFTRAFASIEVLSPSKLDATSETPKPAFASLETARENLLEPTSILPIAAILSL